MDLQVYFNRHRAVTEPQSVAGRAGTCEQLRPILREPRARLGWSKHPAAARGKMSKCYPVVGICSRLMLFPTPWVQTLRLERKILLLMHMFRNIPLGGVFSPTPTPHLCQERAVELLGCRKAENLFPNGSRCCLVTACQIWCWEMLRSVGLKGGI